MPRMHILSPEEQKEFNTPPVFSSHDRKRYFSFSNALLDKAHSFRSLTNRISFLLSCGYFRCSKRFFHPRDFHGRDISYVSNLLGGEEKEFNLETISEPSRRRQRNIILQHYGYNHCDHSSIKILQKNIEHHVHQYLKPKIIFHQSIILCNNMHIIPPGYDQLAKLILHEINTYKKSLSLRIEQHLTHEQRHLIDSLFERNGEESKGRYRITLLKKLSQSVRPAQIKERSSDLSYLKDIYEEIEPIIKVLDLGHEGIQYFASSVLKSDIFHISRREDADKYIHAMSFIAYQYYRLQDNLADTLLSVVTSFKTSAKREHKEKYYAQRAEKNINISNLLNSLDYNVLPVMNNIHKVTQDASYDDTDKVIKITSLITQYHSIASELQEQKSALQESFNTEDYYEILINRSIKLQNRISPILKVMVFEADEASYDLLSAIHHFKEKEGTISKNAPIEFLSDQEEEAVKRGGSFRVSLYKTFLFIHVAEALRSGRINLIHSYKYRSLDGYLIEKSRWEADKTQLLQQADLNGFSNPDRVLRELDEALMKGYKHINHNIDNAQNPYLKITNHKPFSVKTPPRETYYSSLLRPYFPEKHFVPLPEILSTIHAHTNFLDEFHHAQQRYHRKITDRKPLYAAIIGLGCAIGIPKMGRITSQINERTLQNTVDWYFSADNVIEANDRILTLMDKMDLPNTYLGEDGKIHTASDGSKYFVLQDSLQAGQSFKYFGQEQGISINSFIDARGLLWYSIAFSASTRESIYVIDALMHNNVVKSDIHSTDAHGYSESIFATAHMIGISYAPRIKDLKRQPLYIFKHHDKKQREGWSIKPDKYVNDVLIKEYWDDILRFIATIKLKESTASDIFRRLNSYSKQHKLYQALKAFGQIIKTDFILRYLDDVELRQSIEKQLNWVELSNRFSRAVAVGNPREFSQVEGDDQNIAAHCTRLIKNSIICWNYLYLSQKLDRMKDQSEKDKLINALASHSVLCWEHINLLGEYDLSDEKLKDSVGILPPKNIRNIAA